MRTAKILGLAAFTTSIVACSSPSEEVQGIADGALLADIGSMVANPDGSYEVTCRDGHVEHSVTSAAIQSDLVCNARPQIRCRLAYFLFSMAVCGDNGGYCPPIDIANTSTEFNGFPRGR